MSFKKELEEIIETLVSLTKDGLTLLDYDGEKVTATEPKDQALTSIINLVDKELPEKKPNALKPGGIVLSEDGKTVAISNLQSASSGGYNQAIDDMRAKLKGVSNGE